MSFSNFYTFGQRRRLLSQHLKIILCVFFVILFMFNFLYFNSFSNQTSYSNEETNNFNENPIFNEDNSNPEISIDTLMLQNPFTKNFPSLITFFTSNYESSVDPNIPTYLRYGDTNGIITDDSIFSEDNILLYKSLLKSKIDKTETFDIYLNLKGTPLWYEGGDGPFDYGFVKSIENSSGQILNDNNSSFTSEIFDYHCC